MQKPIIGVIGLGYVGLPLAVGLAKHYEVTGLDINQDRVRELRQGFDRTCEISTEGLKASALAITDKLEDLRACTLFIVTVPTPVDEDNHPDLTALEMASKAIGGLLKKGDTVVYESTVYPGVTEDVCGEILEEVSGLKSGVDFSLGYSPERINPGDKKHTVETITKIVSGQSPEVTDMLAEVYGRLNGNNIFKATSIKVAEAAKVIENAQRDINIAFINEITRIFSRLDISIYDVLDAAKTKWNFLPFAPGFVGGHCIGVDPYYLAECAMGMGYYPRVILAGREINDTMAGVIAKEIKRLLKKNNPEKAKRVLVLGLTFKENIPDLRNTKVVDLIASLKKAGHHVDVNDPHADKAEAMDYYGLSLVDLDAIEAHTYDCVVVAVGHELYPAMGLAKMSSYLVKGGIMADVKGLWRDQTIEPDYTYWSL